MSIRKFLSILAGLLILAIATASCGPDIENTDPSNQVITFWYQHSGAREEIIQKMIADFNASNEWKITVQGKYAGSYDEIYKKIVDGIPVHQVPDLTVAYSNQAVEYAKMGGIVELIPYIESPKWGFSKSDLDDFFAFTEIGDYLPEFKGRYGFPNQRSMEVLYYNEDWLRKLGFDHPPHTWEEFEQMACTASNKAEGKHGYVLSVDPSTFADMLFNRDGLLTSADGKSYTFGGQAGLDVLTFLHNLSDKGCLALESEVKQDQDEFSAGRALFTFSSTSGLPDYLRLVSDGANFNWSVSTMPTSLGSPRISVYGASLSIMSTTPEKQLAAWLFIKWLTSTQQTAYWAQSTGYFPVRRSAAELLKNYFSKNPQYGKAFSFLDLDIAVEPGLASWTECRNQISKMFEAATRGGDPNLLLKNAQDECTRLKKILDSPQ